MNDDPRENVEGLVTCGNVSLMSNQPHVDCNLLFVCTHCCFCMCIYIQCIASLVYMTTTKSYIMRLWMCVT